MTDGAENQGARGPEGPGLPTVMAGGQAYAAGAGRARAHGSPHGKPSSWILIVIVLIAFATGGAALAAHLWWLFWTCVGIAVLGIPAGKAVRIMDDTVSYETSASLTSGASPPPEHTADPAEGPAR